MTRWNIHPEAQEEHDELVWHFGNIDPALVIAFEERYLHYRHSICETPMLYNIRRGLVRRVNLTPRFGEYYIAYMIWKDKVVILAVGHAKQKPYYWRKRIGEARKLF